MDYTYELTPTGYNVYRGGALYVSQPFDPDQPGYTPFASQAEAEAHARELVAAITAPAQPEATEPM